MAWDEITHELKKTDGTAVDGEMKIHSLDVWIADKIICRDMMVFLKPI